MGVLPAPFPKVLHQFVAFMLLKNLSLTAHNVIIAGTQFFSKDFVTTDVFAALRQITFGFPTVEKTDAAAKSGFPINADTPLPLTHQADYQPTLRQLTVSNVDCTLPSAALKALKAYFSTYGRVLDVTPRYWADTHVHNGMWK